MNYRLNVAAILRNVRGQILICERFRQVGAWQFPQGGIDKHETPEQALLRELEEEIGVRPTDYRIIARKGPYRYHFSEPNKKGFHGKEQHYFLCDFLSPDSAIIVQTAHPEFRSYRWIRPAEFDLHWLPSMKHEVYRSVFWEFFALKI